MLKKKQQQQQKQVSRDVIYVSVLPWLLYSLLDHLRGPVAAGAGNTALPTSLLLCEQYCEQMLEGLNGVNR